MNTVHHLHYLNHRYHVPKVTTEIKKLVPRIKFNVKPRHNKLQNFEGPKGRVEIIRRILTGLFKFERIEVQQHSCEEVRGYAERLIVEAMRNGDRHPPTMEMADFWLNDKQMIHKLFKVLVPRFQSCRTSFTETFLLPDKCHLTADPNVKVSFYPKFVLELRGHPFPPMPRKKPPDAESLTNILLREAKKDFQKGRSKATNMNV